MKKKTTAASEAPDEDPGTREADFGFRRVAAEDKPRLVRGVFESVAGNYDLMNDLMSGGLHRIWKARFVEALNPRPGEQLLDVAGGTGDIALRVQERLEKLAARRGENGETTGVTVCDLTPAMLALGRGRALDRGLLGEISWCCGDAQNLPFADRRWDAYSIAFGLRNVTDIDAALAEAYRVLKPGGRFLCLEFSRVVLPLLDRLYDLYSFKVLPALGQFVAGDAESYRYLAESIRGFPEQGALASRIEAAGFQRARYRNLSGGIVAIHSAWRI